MEKGGVYMGLAAGSSLPQLVEAEEGTKILAPNVIVTSVDKLVNWGRRSSLWPVTFGLA
jgi:NADH-quinone oxidoreductase subunit B